MDYIGRFSNHALAGERVAASADPLATCPISKCWISCLLRAACISLFTLLSALRSNYYNRYRTLFINVTLRVSFTCANVKS